MILTQYWRTLPVQNKYLKRVTGSVLEIEPRRCGKQYKTKLVHTNLELGS